MKNISVIGAGTMGHALALVHAIAGCKVSLHDTNETALIQATKKIRKAIQTLTETGHLERQSEREIFEKITYTTNSKKALTDADIVVEAVVEKADIKLDVYKEIDEYAPETAILASNTSYLDVFPLMPKARAARSMIVHWYSPPYIIDLVDIVGGPECDGLLVEEIRSFYADMGKAPLVFKTFIPGYVANRLQTALNLECLRMLDEGWVSAGDIDFSIRHGIAERMVTMGHMRKLDFTGLEMVQNGRAAGTYTPPDSSRPSSTLSSMISRGKKGVTSGAGFYDYGASTPEELFEARDRKLLKFKTLLNDLERSES